MSKVTPIIDRVLSRVFINDNDCWIFAGARSAAGYGVVGAGPRGTGNRTTHRVSYEHFIGHVPSGMELDHLCRVRACCNPDHLEPVTRLENIMRGHHPWVLRDPEALKKAHDARWGRSA